MSPVCLPHLSTTLTECLTSEIHIQLADCSFLKWDSVILAQFCFFFFIYLFSPSRLWFYLLQITEEVSIGKQYRETKYTETTVMDFFLEVRANGMERLYTRMVSHRSGRKENLNCHIVICFTVFIL